MPSKDETPKTGPLELLGFVAFILWVALLIFRVGYSLGQDSMRREVAPIEAESCPSGPCAVGGTRRFGGSGQLYVWNGVNWKPRSQ